MKTTGPILTIGAITIANQSLINSQPLNWRIVVATGMAAAAFGLLEQAWAEGAVALAWAAVVTVILVRTNPNIPAPAESFAAFLNQK